MTDAFIFSVGLVVAALCTVFVVVSFAELRRLMAESESRNSSRRDGR